MILRCIFAILGLLAVGACKQESSEELPGLYDEAGSNVIAGMDSSPEPDALLSATDFVRVCKAAQAFSVGRDVNTIKGKATEKNMVRLSYTRDDGKSFLYDCRIDDGHVRTRMIDEAGLGTGPGQWSGRGSKTTFELRDGGIYVKEIYFDGSTDEGLIEI